MLQQGVLYILVFISGLFFGSFLNLVSDRVTKGKSILKGRSHCDHCKKTLGPKNLIPILSYIKQGGKCAKCKKKLSIYYPISELLTGIAFIGIAHFSTVLVAVDISSIITFFYLLVVMSFYIILFLTDLKEKLIPNKIVYPAIIFVLSFLILSAVVYFVLYYNQLKADTFGQYLLEAGILKVQIMNSVRSFVTLIVSASGIAAFFAFLVWITKGRGMGSGDIRLGFLIGLFNGFPFNVMAIFLGFVFGAVISLIMIALKKRTLKDTIPFGPFLIAGSIVALVWGPAIWGWYINLL